MPKELALNTDVIRKLNDKFRTTFQGGRVMLTPGILSLTEATRSEIIRRTMSFTDFNDANDPHQEHNFIAFDHAGASSSPRLTITRCIWILGATTPPTRLRPPLS